VPHEGEALIATCLNTPSYGSGMPIAPAARVDDGALDVVVAVRFGRAGALAMLPRLLLGRHLGHPKVLAAQFAELAIEADVPIPLAADGEPLGESASVAVRVLPGALRVAR
jgi:diacylglycerol kinase family enzyme